MDNKRRKMSPMDFLDCKKTGPNVSILSSVLNLGPLTEVSVKRFPVGQGGGTYGPPTRLNVLFRPVVPCLSSRTSSTMAVDPVVSRVLLRLSTLPSPSLSDGFCFTQNKSSYQFSSRKVRPGGPKVTVKFSTRRP